MDIYIYKSTKKMEKKYTKMRENTHILDHKRA